MRAVIKFSIACLFSSLLPVQVSLTHRAGLSKLRLFVYKDMSADQQLSSDKDITSSGDRKEGQGTQQARKAGDTRGHGHKSKFQAEALSRDLKLFNPGPPPPAPPSWAAELCIVMYTFPGRREDQTD